MLGDKVGQNMVYSAAVDPEKKADEHVKEFMDAVHKHASFRSNVWFCEN